MVFESLFSGVAGMMRSPEIMVNYCNPPSTCLMLKMEHKKPVDHP